MDATFELDYQKATQNAAYTLGLRLDECEEIYCEVARSTFLKTLRPRDASQSQAEYEEFKHDAMAGFEKGLTARIEKSKRCRNLVDSAQKAAENVMSILDAVEYVASAVRPEDHGHLQTVLEVMLPKIRDGIVSVVDSLSTVAHAPRQN